MRAFVPVGAAVVGPADCIVILVSQGTLDCICRPLPGLVKQRTRGAAKPVRGHFLVRVAHPA